ncbi:uncharacterized protein [Dermacentor andersoni]|uniref:uncharacterized protein n=1 Tax=Dermacentor andersoni TaxID=34620 RepID=UPI00241652D4|nr:uncharacterized protein LOC129385662 [Dermacentor andersoni]
MTQRELICCHTQNSGRPADKTAFSVICNSKDHFTPEQFLDEGRNGKKRLKANAVPSICSLPVDSPVQVTRGEAPHGVTKSRSDCSALEMVQETPGTPGIFKAASGPLGGIKLLVDT